MLIGPIESELISQNTGERYFVDLWLCDKCKHPVIDDNRMGFKPESSVCCTHNCKGCECDRSN